MKHLVGTLPQQGSTTVTMILLISILLSVGEIIIGEQRKQIKQLKQLSQAKLNPCEK